MVQTIEKGGTNVADPYLEQFRRFESEKPASWVLPLRKAGMAHFAESGFPTTKHEDWRFTNVAPIAKLPFRPVWDADHGRTSVSRGQVQEFTFASLPAVRLVFVNGHFAPELSTAGNRTPGLTVNSIAAVLSSNPAELEPFLGRFATLEGNPFTALNTAFFRDGAYIRLERGITLAEPVHLVFVVTAPQTGATVHPRNLIIAEENSRLTVLESYVSTVKSAYLTNAVTELIVGDNAALEHLKFQDEGPAAFHVSAIHAQLGRASNSVLHSISLGAKLARNNIRTALAGPGLECILNGLYLTKGEQLADHHMVVEHAQPHCASHEYYNGILDGRSKGVFHGRILVRPLAQKTDAKQTNKNLLLSEDATVDTKPQLEIYADDVKCTHGATVGQLNEEAIFYLRSRGIGFDTARQMLIHSFAGEIIERIRHGGAREELDRLVWDRLEANPHVAQQK